MLLGSFYNSNSIPLLWAVICILYWFVKILFLVILDTVITRKFMKWKVFCRKWKCCRNDRNSTRNYVHPNRFSHYWNQMYINQDWRSSYESTPKTHTLYRIILRELVILFNYYSDIIDCYWPAGTCISFMQSKTTNWTRITILIK